MGGQSRIVRSRLSKMQGKLSDVPVSSARGSLRGEARGANMLVGGLGALWGRGGVRRPTGPVPVDAKATDRGTRATDLGSRPGGIGTAAPKPLVSTLPSAAALFDAKEKGTGSVSMPSPGVPGGGGSILGSKRSRWVVPSGRGSRALAGRAVPGKHARLAVASATGGRTTRRRT